MKKIVRLFYSLIFLFSSFLVYSALGGVYLAPVAAAELPPQNWQCMGVTQAGGHSVNLATKEGNFFIPPEDDVWVVECISSASGNACTTGNADGNAALGLSGFSSAFSVTHNVPQPAKATDDGKLRGEAFLWQTDSSETVNHSFFGVQMNPLLSLSADTANLKFSSFYPQNSDTNCVSIRWDPTGIIFDSKTLEPIPGVPVTIYDQNGSKVNLPGIPNPDITRENGQYNFNVEPNKYYSLRVGPSAHTFPSSSSVLPAQNSPDFPYRGIYRGGLFYETPKILRLDIPVDSATPYVREAKLTDWKVFLDKPTNTLKIDGGVRHPFSKVQVFNGSENLLGSTTADQYGAFLVSVHSTAIDNTKSIELTVEKAGVFNRVQGVSLFDKIISKAFAQTAKNTVVISPIFNYLEGYAYNEKGNVVPNATVQILLTVATKPAYQVQADSTGYFRVPSENIPPLPYSLVIQSPSGSSSTLTLTQFALYNKQYAADNGIDYGQYQADLNVPQYQLPTGSGQTGTGIPGAGGTTANGTTGNSTGNGTGNQAGANGTTNTRPPTYSGSPAPNAGASSQAKGEVGRKNQIALILFSLLLTLAIGAGVYLYKKRKARELEMQK